MIIYSSDKNTYQMLHWNFKKQAQSIDVSKQRKSIRRIIISYTFFNLRKKNIFKTFIGK